MALLGEHDAQRAVFGAGMHQYQRHEPLGDAAVAAFEQRAGVALPDAYRAFVTTRWSSGAGPYYGLAALPESPDPALAQAFDPALAAGVPLRGAIALADQGCGMASVLVVTGPHRGEVWFDFRENGGGVARESPSFDAWIDEWLDRALAEAALPAFAPHVSAPGWAPHPLLDAVADAIERRTADGRAPTPAELQYPFDALPALAYLRVYQSRFGDALAVFDQIRARERDDFAPALQLARARVYRAKGDPERWLAEARAGVALDGAWFSTRASLLREASDAAFVLGRTDDAIGFCEGLARATGAVQDHLMVAWHRLAVGQPERAAAWIVAAATAGIGGERGGGQESNSSVADRVDVLVNRGFLDAVAQQSQGAANALVAELAKQQALAVS